MKPAIIDFINRSFRDVADQDYIGARSCYRFGLELQFLWFAQQALEKYLKAILLYNGKSTKDLGHSLNRAFKRLSTIKDIKFDFNDDVAPFIDYIEKNGLNRYFEFPFYLKGYELYTLDRTVWHIRRYCFYTKSVINNQKHEYYYKNPHKLRIKGGLLEKILLKKDHPARKMLIWKNPCFGARKVNRIKNYSTRFYAANPTHIHNPEVIEELDSLVKFSSRFKQAFKEQQKAKKQLKKD